MVKGIKITELSKLIGLKLNTLKKYSVSDDYLFGASYETIHLLAFVLNVKENIFAQKLGVYLDNTIYLFDETNRDFRNYLGLMYANYYDGRIKEEHFRYNKNNNYFVSQKDNLKLLVLADENDDINVEKINKHSNENTYVVIFPYGFFYSDFQTYEELKTAVAKEVMVVTQEEIYIIKKRVTKEITDTISKSLIMRANTMLLK